MTVFEKIKSCNIDELADYLMGVICEQIDDCPIVAKSCHQCIKDYLERSVEE